MSNTSPNDQSALTSDQVEERKKNEEPEEGFLERMGTMLAMFMLLMPIVWLWQRQHYYVLVGLAVLLVWLKGRKKKG